MRRAPRVLNRITPGVAVPAAKGRLARVDGVSHPPKGARPRMLALFLRNQETGDLVRPETAVAARAGSVGGEQHRVRPAAHRVHVSAQDMGDLGNREHPSIIADIAEKHSLLKNIGGR